MFENGFVFSILCVISRTVVSYARTIGFGFLCVRFFFLFIKQNVSAKKNAQNQNGVIVSEECLKFCAGWNAWSLNLLIPRVFFSPHSTKSNDLNYRLKKQSAAENLSQSDTISLNIHLTMLFFSYTCFNLVHALLFRITRDCGISCCGRNTPRNSEQYRWTVLNE